MTRLLDQAYETVRALPDPLQGELADVLLRLAGVDQPPVALSPAEAADLAEALAEAESGDFASEDAIRALWAKHA
jgi:hypothetical protein